MKSTHGGEVCDIAISGVGSICFTRDFDGLVSRHRDCQNDGMT